MVAPPRTETVRRGFPDLRRRFWSGARDDGELAAWLVDLAGRCAPGRNRDGVIRVQVEALSGVEGDGDVAFEQDEGFVVREVPLENGRSAEKKEAARVGVLTPTVRRMLALVLGSPEMTSSPRG